MPRDPEKKKAAQKRWREANREREAIYKKNWEENNPEKKAANYKRWRERSREEQVQRGADWRAANPEKQKAANLRWRQANKGKVNGYSKQFRCQHPELVQAANAVQKALRSGQLVRPEICEWCGASGKIDAAHEDYADLLEVRWLCRSCHVAWDHREPKLARKESCPS